MLCQTAQGPTTWMYSESDHIIFKITPMYKWHHSDPKEEENYIPYDKFIKNYCPLVTFELPYAIAKKWLAQITEIRTIMHLNYDEYRRIKELEDSSLN